MVATVSTPAPRSRTRLDAQERRDQILAVARAVFGAKPYSAVSLAEIAREAGVARGLLNHYFGDKRGLYLEVLREMLAVPEHAVVTMAPGPVEDRARGMIDRFLAVIERNRGIWLVTVDAMASRGDGEAETVMREAENVTVSRVIDALGLADVADEKLRAAIRAYGAMARSASAEWLTHGALSRAETLDLLTRTLMLIVEPAAQARPRAARR